MADYRKALPPEKWPQAERFLQVFCAFANQAETAGKKLDVGRFLQEYIRAYTKGVQSNQERNIKSKLLRQERKTKGLCPKCGKNVLMPGRGLCRTCAVRLGREYVKEEG